ncbi:MAG: undecaprenyl-diphosphate phosphatase [Bacteroidota bacterium]
MTTFQAIILAIIEGVTEFLPISSTGHMVIASSLMKLDSTPFLKLFTVAVQFGAILSVVVLYFKKFFRTYRFYLKLFVAFIPSAILGLLLSDYIDKALENVVGVSIALIVGGVFFLFVGKIFKNYKVSNSDDIGYFTGLKIGMMQCLALFPGVSRSGATIIGGLAQKCTPQAAAEFSFFLAVPTMFAATAKKCLDFYQDYGLPTTNEISLLLIGNAVAFVVAIIAIKGMIAFLNSKGFQIFGWYRIILGSMLLVINFYFFELKFEEQEKKPLKEGVAKSTANELPKRKNISI